MIKKITTLSFLVIGLFAGSLGAVEKPNFVLIMCDDLGYSDVTFNGGKVIRTPELQAMAENGLAFDRFYAAAPVCSPTRASFISGRHPIRLGIPYANVGYLKKEEYTIAELAKDAGYTTGHFGKWHLGTLSKKLYDGNRGGPGNPKLFSPPWNNGFDICFSTDSKVPTFDPMWQPKDKKSKATWNAISDPKKNGEHFHNRKNDKGPILTRYWNEKGEVVVDNLLGDDSKVVVDRVESFIRGAVEQDKPFMAVVWLHTPHLPVVASVDLAATYEGNERHRNYNGCVTAMDMQVGRVRKLLRELGIEKNTMLTFTSDNGPEGGKSDPGQAGQFSGRKRSLREGGVRVPSLIEWPAQLKPNTRTNYAACTSDYVPTIAAILEIDLPDRIYDGINILPDLLAEKKKRPQPMGFSSQSQRAWHEGNYKIYRSSGKDPWSLHDLESDPAEAKDLAEEMPEKVQEMKANFNTWEQSLRGKNTNSSKRKSKETTNKGAAELPRGSTPSKSAAEQDLCVFKVQVLTDDQGVFSGVSCRGQQFVVGDDQEAVFDLLSHQLWQITQETPASIYEVEIHVKESVLYRTAIAVIEAATRYTDSTGKEHRLASSVRFVVQEKQDKSD